MKAKNNATQEVVKAKTQYDKAAYENIERHKKPFADFVKPELQYLNEVPRNEYLPRPRRVKFDKKPQDLLN